MKIFSNIFEKIDLQKEGIVSIGYFDSMHRGHIKILKELLFISKKMKKIPYVLTYNFIPSKEFKWKKILELSDKLNIMKNIGIKNIILCEFNESFYKLNPENFINLLKNNFYINEFVIEDDFSFGYHKKGNIEFLKKTDCMINIIESMFIKDKKISTTNIKELILNGKIEEANQSLGREFFIRGIVQNGKKIGRTLGFPTMNIVNEKVLYPQDGVYITKTMVNNIKYKSMTYVANPIIETHLLNYNRFHYNFKIKVDFFKKIRDNKVFKNTLLLKKQLEKDLISIEDYFLSAGRN